LVVLDAPFVHARHDADDHAPLKGRQRLLYADVFELGVVSVPQRLDPARADALGVGLDADVVERLDDAVGEVGRVE
jgi:hypothetical protein